jgi:hypothetical protein
MLKAVAKVESVGRVGRIHHSAVDALRPLGNVVEQERW